MKNGSSYDNLEKLEAKLQDALSKSKTYSTTDKASQRQKSHGLSLALRVGVELVCSVTVGTIIGIGLDFWFETTPWLMILFIMMGFIAGLTSIYRLARGYNYYNTEADTTQPSKFEKD